MTLDTLLARTWVRHFETAVLDHAAALGDADRRAGDGDFGDNMRAALRRARRTLDTTAPAGAGDVVLALAEGYLGTGGTSGPLFGMWFRELARALDPADPVGSLSRGLSAGAGVVQRLGGAEVGDKTMVDALAPAAAALSGRTGLTLAEALEAAASAAERGADSTGGLRARRGRASYVGDNAVGVDDPGARTVAMFLRAGATAADSR
ncbi:DAK2 domain-containing protein [Pseudonocardia sp. WMMC193]|uniref:DAK2 domain-containing protein n=1 Tax=Pseudonocardia sp. WMMC193 TaxID=2911965 RepID=UPI001F02A07D|nr:DAK2 domain-containing protein [Pseudonocardia sp. WMMC193]MCF7547896.1 DAK2 domain-containing protein [Pseudonocardia sp. WMMC193]